MSKKHEPTSKKQQPEVTSSKNCPSSSVKNPSMKSKTDPSGSYTGVPYDSKERPVQDADDL